MPPLSLRRRLALIGLNLAACVLFVVVVVLMTPLLATSTLTSVMILVGLMFVYRTMRIMATGRDERLRPPGDSAGDRSPIRPLPFSPAASIKRPLPRT